MPRNQDPIVRVIGDVVLMIEVHDLTFFFLVGERTEKRPRAGADCNDETSMPATSSTVPQADCSLSGGAPTRCRVV